MTASAATLTNEEEGSSLGFRRKTFDTTLAANAEDGVTVPLGWSRVCNCSISHKSASPVQSGFSYNYDTDTGVLTLYGAAASNLLDAATVTVTVEGKD